MILWSVQHVNVAYAHPLAQQSVDQSASQPITTNGIVPFQQLSNWITQHIPQIASINQTAANSVQPASAPQPMVPALPQVASASQPMVPAVSQPTQIANQQVDWTSKIAEVMRDQFSLRPKQQSVMYKTPYPAAYDQISFPHKYKVPDFTKFSGIGRCFHS